MKNITLILIVLTFFGCKKDKLEGDKSILIGTWKWRYTPEVFPMVEMANFDASFNLGDTSSFGAYLANFVSVYPNPTNDFTQIVIPQEVFGNSQFQVEIYNMVGLKVFSEKYIDQNILNLDFSSYPNGMYTQTE